jgi:P-type Mg2+ transporter
MKAYWSRDAAQLLGALGSSAAGLTQDEAEARLERVGENRVTAKESAGALRLLLRQYESPLVLILIFGALISLMVRSWTDAIIILAIVLGSTLLGFAQEYRATEAVKRLRDRVALRVAVLRDGTQQTVNARFIVPGDVILLSAGNLVPADGVVLEARDFLVSQAALTGESFPVEKTPGISAADAPLPERTNAVFLGTSVRSGTAKALVVTTGEATEFGRVAGQLVGASPETAFERGLRKFGYLLTRIMTVIVIFVFTANLLLHRPLIESLLFAVALAVGLTPELLPAIVSVTLSAGARAMAKRGVIVRRLAAIEDLGSVDILCTDKTGTLTKGVVELSATVDALGAPSDRVFRYAALNSRLETGIENPLDAALVAEADRRGLAAGKERKIDEIPYDFVRKRLTIVVAEDGGEQHLIITKGAFETIIACCTSAAGPAGPQPLDAALEEKMRAYCSGKGAEGYRVLGLATKRTPAKPRYDHGDEAGMEFEGFLLFFDPLKEAIETTILELARTGIAVKLVTGDNRYVAAHVGEAVGLDPASLLTGRQLNETRDEALWNLAERTDIFAEVDPQQKERIVLALQERGHVVAFLGDGINDAAALHVADVGVSVAEAVDVARETADIVLLERDLNVLRDGVIGGRRTFANTFKYIAITTSANFGNMISMALGTLIVPFLPLVAKQILLNNFLSDLPAIAISTDNVDPEMTETSQQWNIANIRSFMILFGLISTAFDLVTFAVLLVVYHAGEDLFRSEWFLVSLLTELAVVLVLRTHLPCWRSRPSRLLLASTILVGALALALPYMGVAARTFGFVPLPLNLLFGGLGIVALYVLATEVAKWWFYAKIRSS